MSKTTEIQIEKSSVLIEGLKKNIGVLADKGIEMSQLDEMSADLERLRAANEECDAIRAKLSVAVKNMNGIMTSVKDRFAEKKKIIKQNYMQEQWIKFGVQDKR